MDFYHEEDTTEAKLYSKKVFALLFKYIWKYKKYLFYSILLVLIITGVTVATPYLSKVIIDRYIAKSGIILDVEQFNSFEQDNFYINKAYKGIFLGEKYIFLLPEQSRYFSNKKIKDYKQAGVVKPDNYILIENPKMNSSLSAKINNYAEQDSVIKFNDSLFVLDSNIIKHFSAHELLVLRSSDLNHVLLYVLVVVIILLIQFLTTYAQMIYLTKLSQYAMRDLRKDLYSHIITLQISFFDKNPIGKLVSRVSNDIETLNEMFSSVFITLIQDILMMAGVAVVMFFTDFYLSCIIALSFPFIVLLTILFRYKARSAYRKIRTKISQINSFFNETITGIRVIQIFVQEMKNWKKFMKHNTELYKANIQQVYVYAVFRPLIGFLRWFALGALIYFGAKGILQNRVTYGLIVMFVAYIETFFSPVQDFAEKFDILQSATAAGEKLLTIFNADFVNEKKEEEGLKDYEKKYIKIVNNNADNLYRFNGHIVFEDVWFAYNPGEWILKGVSFEVKPQETLAIVGETGAGKTTITNILNKFYKIQKGRILIDGINLDDIPHSILRKNVSMVMQDVFLFSKTVRENIILNQDFNEKHYNLVKKLTHIDKFIGKLDSHDDEMVMERGATFSAGERQLLSFARALYFNPTILILDEATSNIDTETEKLIQDAIYNLMQNRTSIAIAHRLSTIRDASNILVLEHGKIVEQGNHAQLLEKQGIYYNLYKLQFMEV